MAFKKKINRQISETTTQGSVAIPGAAPAMAMSNLYQASSQALANAAHNATLAQQQNNIVAEAATTQGVALIYSLDVGSTAQSLKTLMEGKQ